VTAALIGAAALTLAGCRNAPVGGSDGSPDARAPLGLMTSLPLYWGEGVSLGELAGGSAAVPWQRRALEADYALVLLDTLSPMPGPGPNAPDVDPLAGLQRIAVIQPRGLSPADNVALDRWVRGGGRLLLALDPALTGDYDTPLGDPRRPVDSALIPPVVARWGLGVAFDADAAARGGATTAALPGAGRVPLALAGTVTRVEAQGADCATEPGSALAICRIGKGRVTLIADAALFEHAALAGTDGATLRRVVAAAFE